MWQWTQLAAALVPLTIVCVDIIRCLVQSRIQRMLPPGPIPLPVLGNALSVDFLEPFKTYTTLREKYGDTMYFSLLDMDVVVLNSLSTASELLDKQSQIYSNRPFMPTVEPYGQDCNFVFGQYGDYLRLCRRMLHQTFSPNALVDFRPVQLCKVHRMISSLMEDPNSYASHYSMFTTSVTMRLVYGYDPSPRDDEMVFIIDRFMDASNPGVLPKTSVLLKMFPFLLRLPDWCPGSSIKKEAKKSREWGVEALETPYQYVKKRMDSNQNVHPSMVADHIARMEKMDSERRFEYEKTLKQASLSAFMGSAATTTSLLLSFTLAMIKNPHVQKRAQAEIDAVVGTDRLPEFHDRASLPYIDAIMRETMRWQPSLPLGVPHATSTDDTYNGFHIPKGVAVLANIWGMTRDETRYPDPDKFIPERFLDANGMLTDDTSNYIFGFGRRTCPGRHVAQTSLWSAIVTMLATLDFGLADGMDISFEADFIKGLIRHPLPFPCSIVPRSHVSKQYMERVLAG